MSDKKLEAPEVKKDVPKSTGEGLQVKIDNVLDLGKDEKLKVQLEIRKLASDLKKEVTNTSQKKTETIKKMDTHFDKLLHMGSVERSELDSIKNDVLTSYVDATLIKPKSALGSNPSVTELEGSLNPVIDQTIDDVNHQRIKETKVDSATGALEIQKKLDKEINDSLATIDQKAEQKYDIWNPRGQMTKAQQDIAFTNYASDITNEINSQLLTVEERTRISYRFELNNLKAAVLDTNTTTTTTNNTTEQSDYSANARSLERMDIPDYSNLFKDAYNNTNYKSDAIGKIKVYDIYKDDHMKEVMNKILNTTEKLSNGTYGINLSKDKGLAGIVDVLGTQKVGGYEFTVNKDTNQIELISGPDGAREDRNITGKDLKAMSKSGLITYEHEKGFLQIDNEWDKMAKILNTAKWNDLETFSTLYGSRSVGYSAAKEMANTKENIKLLTTETVFDFLCDRNGDGVLSGSNTGKTKGEKNERDVGNIFGQQIKFTIDQAIGVQNALHPGTGEQIVIQKIMSNIDIKDSRFSSLITNKQKSSGLSEEFALYNTPANCTRVNLVASIKKYPEFKVFFNAAIEGINGGDDVLTPNLYDTLTGNSVKRFMESKDWEMNIRLEKTIDLALEKKQKEDPLFAEYVKTHNIIAIRENLLSQIMNVADGFTIVGSNTQEGNLRNPGVSKEFVNRQEKTAFINDLTNTALNSLAVGVFNPKNGIRIPVTFAKNWQSASGRTIGSIYGGPSIGYNREKDDIMFAVEVGGDIAEQYNYNRVINSPLDDVASAQYIGAEGRAIIGASLKNLNVGAEASAGLLWEQNPIMGINQVNRQYEAVSKKIFRIAESDMGSYADIYTALVKNINSIDGKYKKFTETNTRKLMANADFVVSFLKANDALKSITTNKGAAINELMSIMQDGNIEQWRSDLLNNIHGKFEITKLSFGVTTNALTLGYIGNKNDGSKTATGTSGTGGNAANNVPATSANSFANSGEVLRAGVFGFYVGARLSNWRTEYKVNANQLANTRNEIGEGKNTDRVNFKTPEQYAKYLSALFNKTDKYGASQLDISIINGKIVISTTSGIKLSQLLNIRVTQAAASEVQYNQTDDVLTIGNVKDIGAYTTARPDGVVRQLCIGSKRYEDGTVANLLGTGENQVNAIKMKETGNYEATSFADIEKIADTNIDNTTERALLKSCFDTNGQLKAETPGVTIENRGVISVGKSIVFRKDKEGKFFLSVVDGKAGLLSLSYADGEKFAKGEVIDFKGTSTKYEVNSPSPEIKTILDSLKDTEYANLEKNTKGGLSRNYITFMDYCDKDLNKASAALWNIIPATGKLGEIKKMLETARLNKDEKLQRYLVDQFKGLFAYETSYEGKTIGQIFAKRGDAFIGLLGEKTPQSLKNEVKKIRDGLVKENSGQKYSELKVPKTTIPELFGYTAFYRKQLNTDQRKFSLVSTADTTIMPVGGKPYTNIEGKSGDEAKEWILNKIDTNTEQKQLLLDSLLSNIKDETTRKAFAEEIGMEDIKAILKGEPFVLESGMKRLSLKTTPAFYFKGECANESIGLVINTLEIQDAPVKETEIKKELVTDLNVDTGILTVAGSAQTTSKNLSGRVYGDVTIKEQEKYNDGSSTQTGTKDKGGDPNNNVPTTPANNFGNTPINRPTRPTINRPTRPTISKPAIIK